MSSSTSLDTSFSKRSDARESAARPLDCCKYVMLSVVLAYANSPFDALRIRRVCHRSCISPLTSPELLIEIQRLGSMLVETLLRHMYFRKTVRDMRERNCQRTGRYSVHEPFPRNTRLGEYDTKSVSQLYEWVRCIGINCISMRNSQNNSSR